MVMGWKARFIRKNLKNAMHMIFYLITDGTPLIFQKLEEFLTLVDALLRYVQN